MKVTNFCANCRIFNEFQNFGIKIRHFSTTFPQKLLISFTARQTHFFTSEMKYTI